MPKRYTVQNNETGKTVTFDWNDDVNPPTDADLEEVFAADAATSAASHHPLNIFDPESGIRKLPGKVWDTITSHPAEAGAMAAGIAAAPLTGGMSALPMMATMGAASAAGAAAGRGISEAAQGHSLEEALPKMGHDALVEGTMNAAFSGVGPGLTSVGRGLYRSALRKAIPMGASAADVEQLVDTGIREGINVSAKGASKATDVIEGLSGDVRKLVDSLNVTVDPEKGFKQIAAFRAKKAAGGALQPELDAIDKVAEDYASRFGSAMPGSQAQTLKEGIWRETSNAWEKQLNPSKVEAQKAFGTGIKEGIEDVTGGATGAVAKKNARMGDLIELRNKIAHGSAREATPGAAEAADLVIGGPAMAVGKAIGRSPRMKSFVGRKVADVGEFLDPRFGFRPQDLEARAVSPAAVVTSPATKPVPKAPTTLDQFGIPEEAGTQWAPDALDALGVPVERGSADVDEAWMRRYAQDPRIVHNPPPAPPRTLDQLGVPENAGPAYQPDQLSALGIPADQEMYSPEELWLKKILQEPEPRIGDLNRPAMTPPIRANAAGPLTKKEVLSVYDSNRPSAAAATTVANSPVASSTPAVPSFDINTLFGGTDDFGILTAANPAGQVLDAATNAARNAALERELRALGYAPIPQRGIFGGEPEPSFLVPGLKADETKFFGNRHGQQAVISREGWHRLGDNATFPRTGGGVAPEAQDFYSELTLPTGEQVKYQLQFPDEAFEAPAQASAAPSALDSAAATQGASPNLSTVPGMAAPIAAAGVPDDPDSNSDEMLRAVLLGVGGASFGAALIPKLAETLPPAVGSLAKAIMKTDVPGRYALRPEVIQRLKIFHQIGTEMPNPANWEGTNKELLRAFNGDVPRAQRWLRLWGATSPNTGVPKNTQESVGTQLFNLENPGQLLDVPMAQNLDPIKVTIAPAKVPNINRAFQDQPLSGDKVEAMAGFMIGQPRLPLDVHALHALGIEQPGAKIQPELPALRAMMADSEGVPVRGGLTDTDIYTRVEGALRDALEQEIAPGVTVNPSFATMWEGTRAAKGLKPQGGPIDILRAKGLLEAGAMLDPKRLYQTLKTAGWTAPAIGVVLKALQPGADRQ